MVGDYDDDDDFIVAALESVSKWKERRWHYSKLSSSMIHHHSHDDTRVWGWLDSPSAPVIRKTITHAFYTGCRITIIIIIIVIIIVLLLIIIAIIMIVIILIIILTMVLVWWWQTRKLPHIWYFFCLNCVSCFKFTPFENTSCQTPLIICLWCVSAFSKERGIFCPYILLIIKARRKDVICSLIERTLLETK